MQITQNPSTAGLIIPSPQQAAVTPATHSSVGDQDEVISLTSVRLECKPLSCRNGISQVPLQGKGAQIRNNSSMEVQTKQPNFDFFTQCKAHGCYSSNRKRPYLRSYQLIEEKHTNISQQWEIQRIITTEKNKDLTPQALTVLELVPQYSELQQTQCVHVCGKSRQKNGLRSLIHPYKNRWIN